MFDEPSEPLEVLGLKANLLHIKNELLDQACLRQTVAQLRKQVQILTFENEQLVKQNKDLAAQAVRRPMEVHALDEELQKLQCLLQSERFLNEQLQHAERPHEHLRKALDRKDAECRELKRALQTTTAELEKTRKRVAALEPLPQKRSRHPS